MATTPGPWKLWPDHWAGGWGEHSSLPNRIRILPDTQIGEIAYIEHHGAGAHWPTTYPTDEDYANARLIAAAPAQNAALEAAQGALIALTTGAGSPTPAVVEGRAALALVNAALAAAR